MKLPHDEVKVRLGLSKIHGIGVLALRNIASGEEIFGADADDMVFVDAVIVDGLPEESRKFYEDFCVFRDDFYACPQSFNLLTPSWYMNHADEPNTEPDDELRFIALRNIEKGEELTWNYKHLLRRRNPLP